jgi:hypothetical protein
MQNCHEKFLWAIKYSNIFHSLALQNVPKFGLLVLKYTIWQPRALKYG